MPPEPEQLLERAIDSGVMDAQKGQAALSVYARLREMGAEFGFGEFLVERGLLTRMAVDALESDSEQTYESTDTLGDFELIELMGEGENGAVFRAIQKSLDRDVAVKVLNTEIAKDEAAVERFLTEARAVAKLNHPNIVQVYCSGTESAGTEHKLHYFAMELLEGGSARSVMEEALKSPEGRLGERRALGIALQAAEGLKAAHARGILHRDVKPDNILLSHDGVAKLTDLGISQTLHETGNGGTFWGSPPYVAPEIIKGAAANDPRSDIYSLGATLFELLIGAPPFLDEDGDPAAILRKHLSEEPLDIRQLRPELHPKTGVLVRLMLAKEPNERARDADVVARAIEKILVDLKQIESMRGTQTASTPVKKAPVQPARRAPAAKGMQRKPLLARPAAARPGAAKPLPRKPIQPVPLPAQRLPRPIPGKPVAHPRAPLPGAKRPK